MKFVLGIIGFIVSLFLGYYSLFFCGMIGGMIHGKVGGILAMGVFFLVMYLFKNLSESDPEYEKVFSAISLGFFSGALYYLITLMISIW